MDIDNAMLLSFPFFIPTGCLLLFGTNISNSKLFGVLNSSIAIRFITYLSTDYSVLWLRHTSTDLVKIWLVWPVYKSLLSCVERASILMDEFREIFLVSRVNFSPFEGFYRMFLASGIRKPQENYKPNVWIWTDFFEKKPVAKSKGWNFTGIFLTLVGTTRYCIKGFVICSGCDI